MKFGSRSLGVAIFIVAVLVAIIVTLGPEIAGGQAPNGAGGEAPLSNNSAHLEELFATLPVWVTRWLAIQRIIFAGALLFVIWHREAQAYLAAIIASHVLTILEVSFLPASYFNLELLALNHWLWIPVLVLFVKNWPQIDKQSGYGTWYIIATAQLAFSLVFDVRDGIRYIASFI